MKLNLFFKLGLFAPILLLTLNASSLHASCLSSLKNHLNLKSILSARRDRFQRLYDQVITTMRETVFNLGGEQIHGFKIQTQKKMDSLFFQMFEEKVEDLNSSQLTLLLDVLKRSQGVSSFKNPLHLGLTQNFKDIEDASIELNPIVHGHLLSRVALLHEVDHVIRVIKMGDLELSQLERSAFETEYDFFHGLLELLSESETGELVKRYPLFLDVNIDDWVDQPKILNSVGFQNKMIDQIKESADSLSDLQFISNEANISLGDALVLINFNRSLDQSLLYALKSREEYIHFRLDHPYYISLFELDKTEIRGNRAILLSICLGGGSSAFAIYYYIMQNAQSESR